jgi:CRISPR-associated protein Csx10
MTVTRLYPFILTLRTPALLAGVDGDASGARTLPYIPGSSVRGALARALTEAGREAELDELVLSAAVRYLHAYPQAGGARAYPCPLSLRSVRGEPGRAYDLSAFPSDGQSWPGEPLKGAPGAFLAVEGGRLTPVWPAISTRVHHQRDRQAGRATRDQGALFSYGALDAGQEFAGLIAVNGADADTCEALRARVGGALGGELLVGRSRRAEYGGGARLQWRPALEREFGGHAESLTTDLRSGDAFRLLCLSDVIVRARDTGQLDPAALSSEIIGAFGDRVVLDSGGGKQAVFSEVQMVGGYNRTWGLPLPQAAAARAGSVLCLRATDELPLADVLALEAAGLGERRTEGFGRVAFLRPATAAAITVGETRDARPRVQVWRPPEPVPDLVLQLEERLLADAVLLEISRVAANLDPDSDRLPRPSLLGRLRIPFRRPAAEALETLRRWLPPRESAGRGALRPPAREQLERCRVTLGSGRLSLAEALRAIANLSDQAPVRWLRLDDVAATTFMTSERDARARLAGPRQQESMRAALASAMIEALARAARRQGRTMAEASVDGSRE